MAGNNAGVDVEGRSRDGGRMKIIHRGSEEVPSPEEKGKPRPRSAQEWAERARQCEQDAQTYPGEAAEALLDAAAAWKNAGDFARAEATVRRVLGDVGTDDLAWPTLIDVLLAAGRDEEAREELERLAASGPSAGACVHTAELFEVRGEYEAALEWADRAVIVWGGSIAGAVERMGDDPGPFVMLASGAGTRARVRALLGCESDELDSLVERSRATFARMLDDFAAAHTEHGRGAGGAGPVPKEVHGLFWRRGDLEEVARRWPTLVPLEVVDSGSYWADLEGRFAAAADSGIPTVTIVPADPDVLAELAAEEGLPVEDDGLRWRHRQAQCARGLAISWPPARNGPCWCDSGRKYKKCCGNPADRSQ
jgi:hypothetical protein